MDPKMQVRILIIKIIFTRLIERNPPPGGGFLFTLCPDQKSCVRDLTTRCDGRISS